MGGAYPGGQEFNFDCGEVRIFLLSTYKTWFQNTFIHYLFLGGVTRVPEPPIQYIRLQPMRDGHVKDYSFKKPNFFKPDIHSIQITGPKSMFMNKTICWSLESESDYHISAVWEMLTSAGELQGRINPRIICIRRILISIRRIFNVSYTSWRKIYFFL